MGEPEQLDRKYAELASHLKACWAFEQFHHRLRRSLSEPPDTTESADLAAAYDDLKQIAGDLDGDDPRALATRLASLEERLAKEAAQLRSEDSKLSAADLRRFLGRVRRLDEELLFELLRFYIFAVRGRAWGADFTDKVDFLLSRLGEEVSGPLLAQNRVRLEAFLVSLWGIVQAQPPQKAVVTALRSEIEKVAAEVQEIETLEALQEAGTIRRYRRLKHGLGAVFVEPSVAMTVLSTNAGLSRKVQRLYDEEEWAIAASFARLAGQAESVGLSESLGLELDSLKLDMERLEEGRRLDDVRIETMRQVRQRADSVLPHLDPAAAATPADRPPEASPTPPDISLQLPSKAELAERLLDKLFGQLETLLAASASVAEAEAVLQDPGLPLGLERREVEAFLLLRDEGSPDPDLDRMLLTAASLRLRLAILRDHLESGVAGSTELDAAVALDLGEELLGRFERLIQDLERSGPTAESSRMRFLRVCLMRDYSVLWLEVNGTD